MIIFPNPTVEQLNIKLSNPTNEIIHINIWNTNGNNVFNQTYRNTDNQLITINSLNELAKGNYIVQVTNGTETIGSKPFVKL
jgi:methionine-rich copper-binding protein CopC